MVVGGGRQSHWDRSRSPSHEVLWIQSLHQIQQRRRRSQRNRGARSDAQCAKRSYGEFQWGNILFIMQGSKTFQSTTFVGLKLRNLMRPSFPPSCCSHIFTNLEFGYGLPMCSSHTTFYPKQVIIESIIFMAN